ncbi:MAG: geranylgeranylglyceryl/heptaprenylglyceryl phosphate synthase [Bacteroidota bacterium]
MKGFYRQLTEKPGKRFALLIDPDKHTEDSLRKLFRLVSTTPPDLILAGGSLLFKPIGETIRLIKSLSTIPVFIFPGNVLQLSDQADGILFLSMISGRNPEFLIGNHVLAAPHLRASGIEVIPTGYMLIENGHSTSVEYMSQTRPIPFGKTDIAVATAMAGEMLGLRMLYLEAGSGASHPVGIDMIRAIREAVSLPMIVGGGIRNTEDAEKAWQAGADLLVIGTAIEGVPEKISEFAALRNRLNS